MTKHTWAKAISFASAACLLAAAWAWLSPVDYRGKFRELVTTLRAVCWLFGGGLAVVSVAPLRVRQFAASALDAADGRLTRKRCRALLGLMFAAYVAAFGVFSILRHERFNSSTYDLAVYDQAIWNTTQGRWLETSIEAKPGQYLNLLGDHVAPILTLLAPLYLAWPSVHALLLFQTLALASGAFCVYGIALGRLGSATMALVFAAAYLLCPAVGFVNRFDCHPAALAIPLFLAGILCVERQRWGWAALALGAAMLCKEDMGLTVAAFGLMLALARRRWRFGLALAVVGVTASLVAMFVVLPGFRGEPSDTWARYEHWGATPTAALSYVLRHPGQVLRDVVEGTPLKSAFIFKALLPLGFLSLLCPSALAVTLPAFGYNLVSANPSQSSIYFHYMSPLLPFIFYAAILGAQRIVQARSAPSQAAARAALCLAIAASTATALALDCPFTKRITFPYWEVYGIERTCDAVAAREITRRVPPGASVAAAMSLGPHLAHRRSLRLLWPMKSARLPDTDYVVADLADFRWNSAPNATTAKKNLALILCQAAAKGYGLVASAGSVVLLERAAASAKSTRKLMALLATYLGPELRALRRSAHSAAPSPIER